MTLLEIRNLTIEIPTKFGSTKVLDRINLTINEGEIHALVGEPGSGKSLVAQIICGLIEDNWTFRGDAWRLNGVDLFQLPARRRHQLIGTTVSLIDQDPVRSLDPFARIGRQLLWAITPKRYDRSEQSRFFWRSKVAVDLLHRVGLREHPRILHSYPCQLTRGECQKVAMAIAIACQPKLLIADDPANAMDPANQEQTLRLLHRLSQLGQAAILLIGRDLTTVAQWAETISIIYCGQIIESAPVNQLLDDPLHPYTLSLYRCARNFFHELPHKGCLNSLQGDLPEIKDPPIGCRFAPCCPFAQKKCMTTPKSRRIKHRTFSCHFPLNMGITDDQSPRGPAAARGSKPR